MKIGYASAISKLAAFGLHDFFCMLTPSIIGAARVESTDARSKSRAKLAWTMPCKEEENGVKLA